MAVELQQFIIVILIMSAFVYGVTAFTGDLYNNYPNVQNVSYLDQSGKTMTAVNEMQNTIVSNKESTSITDIMLNGVWQMFTVLYDVLQIFISLISDIVSIFNLPGAFGTIFTAIITVMIIFGIAYAVMNIPR